MIDSIFYLCIKLFYVVYISYYFLINFLCKCDLIKHNLYCVNNNQKYNLNNTNGKLSLCFSKFNSYFDLFIQSTDVFALSFLKLVSLLFCTEILFWFLVLIRLISLEK